MTVLLLGFIVLMAVTIMTPRREPAPAAPPVAGPVPPAAPAAVPQAPPVADAEATGALPEGLAIGDRVEVMGDIICDTVDLLRRRLRDGGRPPGAQNGKEVFGAEVAQSAVVESLQPGAVQARLTDGNWKGRAGWVRPDEVRKPPTAEESAADVVRGIDLVKRREVYQAYYRAGMDAVRAADEHFPFSSMPTDENGVRAFQQRRKAVYDEAKLKGRREVLKRYRIDGAQLDAIEKEGESKKWPLD